jgi:NAD-dependent SIR2 family protein deacetylase
MRCSKCFKEFDPNTQEMEIRNRKKIIRCPYCRTKYEKFTFSGDYIRLKNGQLIRRAKLPKIKKKERLKKRRGQTQKGISSDAEKGNPSPDTPII